MRPTVLVAFFLLLGGLLISGPDAHARTKYVPGLRSPGGTDGGSGIGTDCQCSPPCSRVVDDGNGYCHCEKICCCWFNNTFSTEDGWQKEAMCDGSSCQYYIGPGRCISPSDCR